MMKRLAILVGVSAALALGTGEATAQAGIWLPPACKLNTKGNLIGAAQSSLKNATQAKDATQRATGLRDAKKSLDQAMTDAASDKTATQYFLARYYLMAGDLASADAAFNEALKGAPDCKDDIEQQRRNAWVPEVQAAADALNKQDLDGAKTHFRNANAIYQGDP